MVVECQGILFSLVSSTNHNLSQRSSSFCGPWRHEPSNFFFSPHNFPQGHALRLPPSHYSAAYFKGEALALGENDPWVTGFPPWCHGHRSLLSLKSPLKQKKGNFDLVREKFGVWNTFLFLFLLLFLALSFFLYWTHKRKPFFSDEMRSYHSFEYCSKYINHSVAWLNGKDNVF